MYMGRLMYTVEANAHGEANVHGETNVHGGG